VRQTGAALPIPTEMGEKSGLCRQRQGLDFFF